MVLPAPDPANPNQVMLVGRDIMPGIYRSAGPFTGPFGYPDVYWWKLNLLGDTNESSDGVWYDEALRDPTLVCIRNSDYAFFSRGFREWVKVSEGTRDLYVKTAAGMKPVTRFPYEFHVRTHGRMGGDPFGDLIIGTTWHRNDVVGNDDVNLFPASGQRLSVRTGDGYWHTVGFMAAEDGDPLLQATPPRFGAASRYSSPIGGYAYATTSDGSDPLSSATEHNDTVLSPASIWQRNQDGTQERQYVAARYIFDHDWAIGVRDRLCRSGVQAFIAFDLHTRNHFSFWEGLSGQLEGPLTGFNAYIKEIFPSYTSNDTAFGGATDGSLPSVQYVTRGSTGATLATLPIVAETSFFESYQAYLLPVTLVPGLVSGLSFEVDSLPDGTVPFPGTPYPPVDPASCIGTLFAEVINPGFMFATSGERPEADWVAEAPRLGFEYSNFVILS